MVEDNGGAFQHPSEPSIGLKQYLRHMKQWHATQARDEGRVGNRLHTHHYETTVEAQLIT